MSFTDTGKVGELHLTDHISIRADDDKTWITGKVIRLAFIEDGPDIQLTLKTKAGELFTLDRTPDTMTIIEWGDDE
jgi:hypothetical protein